MHILGGQVAIVKFAARYHAKITKTLNFLAVRLSGFTLSDNCDEADQGHTSGEGSRGGGEGRGGGGWLAGSSDVGPKLSEHFCTRK